MCRSFFDSTLDFNWDMIPIDRSLDPNKVQEYLSYLNELDRSFVQELLSKTNYVRYADFKKALLQSFELFKQEITQQDFYLLLPTDKIGSEHWLTALLWPQLRTLNLKEIVNCTSKLPLQGVTNILIIDDAIYSGNNTIAKIDDFTYELAESLNLEDDEVGKYFNFHIMIPFITPGGTRSVRSFCKERQTQCTIYGVYYLLGLTSLIDVKKYYPENAEDILYQKFGIEILNLPPVYFDHKVAGPMSTFSTIYLEGRIPDDGSYGSLFKVNPSREKIEELERLYQNWSQDTK